MKLEIILLKVDDKILRMFRAAFIIFQLKESTQLKILILQDLPICS